MALTALLLRAQIDSASCMTNNQRVFNVTRGFRMKHKQAVKAVEACACAWVDFGVSVRDLTLQEAIERRNEQARLRDPLPYAELVGLAYRPARGNEASHRMEITHARLANEYAQCTAPAIRSKPLGRPKFGERVVRIYPKAVTA